MTPFLKAFELGHVIADSDSCVLLTLNPSSGRPESFCGFSAMFPDLGEQDPQRLALRTEPALRTIVDLADHDSDSSKEDR